MAAVIEQPTHAYLSLFGAAEKTLPGARWPWLVSKRQEAIRRFAETGFPTQRLDAWRYTPIDGVANVSFQLPTSLPTVDRSTVEKFFISEASARLVFLNGRFSTELSKIPANSQARVGTIADFFERHPEDAKAHIGRYADARAESFTWLNTALFSDGAHVYVPQNVALEAPIQLLYLMAPAGAPVQAHPRSLIVLGQNAKATVVETFAGLRNEPYLSNTVTEIVLGENSHLDHYKVQQESASAFHVATTQVMQKRSSVFNTQAILLGGAVSRNNVNIGFADPGAECTLNGLYLATGKQVVDTHTWVDHSMPHCMSREYYKGILDQKAQGVFDGHVIVRQEAQKTDSAQSNKNLLLSNEARVNTKPELKIFANDVKCKHGATIGQINAEQWFYLRSRGVPKEEARKLLIFAFASEMIDAVAIPSLRDALREQMFAKFQE